jgi:hypothetical protein
LLEGGFRLFGQGLNMLLHGDREVGIVWACVRESHCAPTVRHHREGHGSRDNESPLSG